MSDGRRNRKYNKLKEDKKLKQEESKRPITLAKRDPGGRNDKPINKSANEEPIQPKILLKPKEKEPPPPPPQISIATREITNQQKSQSPSNITIQAKEKDLSQHQAIPAVEPLPAPVPQMTRPAGLISRSSYQLNTDTLKLFLKSNTEFQVVGVIGTQGVGKTTILNLIAADNHSENTYEYFFKEKDGVFPVKFKQGKCSSFPRTDSIQLFITKDRMILIDCPPVLCNSYRKDATTNELEDIKMIILLLTVCHVVVVVHDDYFNLSLLRLLQFAELTKPNQDTKPFIADYFPNILFVKNKAKRNDFLPVEKDKMEKMLKNLFKDSHLKILVGQCDKQKRLKPGEELQNINYFVFPEVKGDCLVAHHKKLEYIARDLQYNILGTPTSQMYNGNTELTEALWFELLTTAVINKSHFFLSSYEEVRRCHTYSNNDQSGGNKSSNVNYTDVID